MYDTLIKRPVTKSRKRCIYIDEVLDILNEVLAQDLIEILILNFGTISLRFSMRKTIFFRKGIYPPP